MNGGGGGGAPSGAGGGAGGGGADGGAGGAAGGAPSGGGGAISSGLVAAGRLLVFEVARAPVLAFLRLLLSITVQPLYTVVIPQPASKRLIVIAPAPANSLRRAASSRRSSSSVRSS